MEKILVIGAAGQIGTELTLELRKKYGADNIFASDLKNASDEVCQGGPFAILNVLDEKLLNDFISGNSITQIYMLAALLSGNAEKKPLEAWNINMKSLLNVLNL